MYEPHQLLHIAQVDSARAGNSEAFTALFQEHQHGVYGYLAGLVGNNDDAYDLTQCTFFKAWQELPKLREAAKFKPWLYRIARNLAYDQGRRKKRFSWISLDGLDDEASGLVHRSDPAEYLSQRDQIEQILAQLPQKYRECLLLQIEGGLSHREIADIVGIGEQSVTTYISNARRLFRQLYYQQDSSQPISIGKEVSFDEQ